MTLFPQSHCQWAYKEHYILTIGKEAHFHKDLSCCLQDLNSLLSTDNQLKTHSRHLINVIFKNI